jgi:hypothetical protein
MVLMRLFFLVLSVPVMAFAGVAEVLGPGAIPYQVREIFPVSWTMDYPASSFYGAVIVFVVALLSRPNRAVLVNDFKE